MTYEDLYEGMELICNKTDGSKRLLKVVRKGIDGFGCESVVFQFPSGGQAYCKKNDVPRWYIRPAETEILKLEENNMAKFRVRYRSIDYIYSEVEADTFEEAKEIAENIDGGKLVEHRFGDWEYDHTEDENGNVIDK